MRSKVMSVSSVRLFRLALGTLLLLVGTSLLVARGIAWLDLDPRMLRALEGGALCALGTALGAVPVLVICQWPWLTRCWGAAPGSCSRRRRSR